MLEHSSDLNQKGLLFWFVLHARMQCALSGDGTEANVSVKRAKINGSTMPHVRLPIPCCDGDTLRHKDMSIAYSTVFNLSHVGW